MKVPQAKRHSQRRNSDDIKSWNQNVSQSFCNDERTKSKKENPRHKCNSYRNFSFERNNFRWTKKELKERHLDVRFSYIYSEPFFFSTILCCIFMEKEKKSFSSVEPVFVRRSFSLCRLCATDPWIIKSSARSLNFLLWMPILYYIDFILLCIEFKVSFSLSFLSIARWPALSSLSKKTMKSSTK